MLTRREAIDRAVSILLPKRMYGGLQEIAASAGMTRQQLDYHANREIERRLAAMSELKPRGEESHAA